MDESTFLFSLSVVINHKFLFTRGWNVISSIVSSMHHVLILYLVPLLELVVPSVEVDVEHDHSAVGEAAQQKPIITKTTLLLIMLAKVQQGCGQIQTRRKKGHACKLISSSINTKGLLYVIRVRFHFFLFC